MKKNKKDLLFLFLLFFSFCLMFNKDLNLFVEGKLKQLMFGSYHQGLENLRNLNEEYKAFQHDQRLNFEDKAKLAKKLLAIQEQQGVLKSDYNKAIFENTLLKNQQKITQHHYERKPIATFKVIYFVKGAKYLIYAKIDNPRQKKFLQPKMPVYSNGFLVGNINKIFDN